MSCVVYRYIAIKKIPSFLSFTHSFKAFWAVFIFCFLLCLYIDFVMAKFTVAKEVSDYCNNINIFNRKFQIYY